MIEMMTEQQREKENYGASESTHFNKDKIYAIDHYKNEKNGNITSVAFMHKGDRHPEV
jgi:hypothetical protein